nr:VOC family protein [Arsenicicoccus sp. oral taxon 190]
MGGSVGAEPLVTGLDHVQVSCAAGDEGRARAFYGEVLGMEEVPKPERLAARGGCWFRSGSAQVHVGVEPGFAPARKAHPCLVVTDLDRAADRLLAAGHEVVRDDAIPGVRRLHTHDGSGNRVELQQAP